MNPGPATALHLQYVLMTAAKNEVAHIGKTIDSVARQTVLPIQWIIVDDCSTDATREVIDDARKRHPFIRLLVNQEERSRDFGAKASVLQKAFELLKNEPFDFIGNLDADVSFNGDFYATIIGRCEKEPRLGITGGVIWEQTGGEWRYSHLRPSWCVGGATHFFRRSCFEDIGCGYPALRYGGEDTVIEYLAREKGWAVSAMTDLPVFHHKPSLSLEGKSWRASFRMGIQEYHWGAGFLFELFKCITRIPKKPYIVDGVARFCGYASQWISMVNTDVPRSVARIVRQQQRRRLWAVISGHGKSGSMRKEMP